jgi:hypothetical protein
MKGIIMTWIECKDFAYELQKGFIAKIDQQIVKVESVIYHYDSNATNVNAVEVYYAPFDNPIYWKSKQFQPKTIVITYAQI